MDEVPKVQIYSVYGFLRLQVSEHLNTEDRIDVDNEGHQT